MKHLFLSLAVLVACAGTATAQEADNHFGIKAGASLTNLVGKDVTSSTNSLIGYHGGLVANIALSERFSIQPELLYSVKGVKTEQSFAGTTFKATQNLHYVDLPVMLKAKFNQVFVEAGPQAGVLVRAKSKVEGGSTTEEVSNKDEFSKLDFGYALGVGYQLESGPMVGFRYNGGITNVAQAEIVGGQRLQAKARNSAFQLYVGYMFGGSK